MAVVGVDEAGRGPVLGSMFAAAVRVTDPAALPDGLDDSKALTPGEREALDATLRSDHRVTISLAEVEPTRIDDPDSDMNTLTVVAHADALASLARRGDRILLDACDVDTGRFARRVGEHVQEAFDVERSFDLHAEHGADATYAVVSAASVVAKVARDAHVATLSEEFGTLGSGYPSDPATRSFLREYVSEHGCLPDCARASWRTSRDVLARLQQAELGGY